MPIEPNTLRNIANSAVPSPLSSRGSVKKVTVVIGTNMKASAPVCAMRIHISVSKSMSGVSFLEYTKAKPISVKPMAMM